MKKFSIIFFSVLAAVVLLVGIAFFVYYMKLHSPSPEAADSSTTEQVQTQTTDTDDDAAENINGPYQDAGAGSVSSTPIVYGQAAFDSFHSYISEYQVEYLYDQMVTSEEADAYFAENDFSKGITHSFSGIIKNGAIDEMALLEAVKVNSPAFKEAGDHYLYTEFTSDEEYAAVISLIAQAINPDLAGKTPEELAEIDCTLADLKLYYGTGAENAKVTTERAMLINTAMIDTMTITTGLDDAYRDIIYHESKHLEQMDCPDRADADHIQQGISRTNNDLTINPYSWVWSVEGGAELGSMNMTKDPPTTYKYLVGYMESLDLISLPNELNTNGHAAEEATTDRDIDGFYQLMGVGSGFDERDIVKMMYAMEIVQQRVDDYQTDFEAIYGQTMSDDDFLVAREKYRTDFLLQASLIFYNNLAQAIVDKEGVTLEDIFALMTVYEGDLNWHLRYDQGTNRTKEYNLKFLSAYADIQKQFMDSLASANHMDVSDVLASFNCYLLFEDEEKGRLNCTLDWMNEDKAEWLFDKASGDRIFYTKPINLIISGIAE